MSVNKIINLAVIAVISGSLYASDAGTRRFEHDMAERARIQREQKMRQDSVTAATQRAFDANHARMQAQWAAQQRAAAAQQQKK